MGNLPATWKEEELRALLPPYGELKSCKVDAGWSGPWYALVEMEAAEAEQAVAALSGSVQAGRPLQIRVQTEDPRADRLTGPRTAGEGTRRFFPVGKGRA